MATPNFFVGPGNDKKVPDFFVKNTATDIPKITITQPESNARDFFVKPAQNKPDFFVQEEKGFLDKAKTVATIGAKALTSTAAQPAQFISRVGSTIGAKIEDGVQLTVQKLGLEQQYRKFWQNRAVQLGMTTPQDVQNLNQKFNSNPVFKFLTFDEQGTVSPYASKKEFALDGLEAMLNVGTALVPTASVFSAGTAIKPLVSKAIAGKTLTVAEKSVLNAGIKRLAVTAGVDTAIGGAFGAVGAAKTGTSIKHGAITGAGFGLLFPIGAGAIFKGAGRLGIALSQGLETAGVKLQQKFAPAAQIGLYNIANGSRQGQTASGMIQRSLVEIGKRLENLPTDIETKMLDGFAALRRFENKAAAMLGRPLQRDEKTYMRARLSWGKMKGITNALMNDYNQVLNPKVNDLANQYLLARDLEWRLRHGQAIDERTSVKEVVDTIREFKARPDFAEIERAALDKKQFFDTLLAQKERAGIYDREFIRELQARPWYAPHRVLDYYSDEMGPQYSGAGLNFRDGDIKKAVGSERAIAPVDEAVADMVARHAEQLVKKDLADAVWSISEALGNNSPMRVLRNADNVKQRQLYYQELKGLRQQLNAVRRELPRTKKLDRAIQAEVNRLSAQVRELEETLAERTSMFLNDEDKFRITPKTERMLQLPRDLYYLGGEINKFKTYDDFRRSTVGVREFETGILESYGIASRKELYDRAKSTVVTGGGTITPVLAPTRKELVDRNRFITSQRGKLADLEEIDAASIRDALTNLQRQFSEIDGRRKDIFDVLKNEIADEKVSKIGRVEEGMEIVSRFRNGIREDMLVPKDFAEAIKMTNWHSAGPLSKLWQWMAWLSGASLLRPLVTTFSPEFALVTNPLRDVQTAAILSEKGLRPDDYVRGMAAALGDRTGRTTELYDLAKKQGVFVGTIFDDGKTPNNLLRGIPLKTETKTLTRRAISAGASIPKAIEKAALTFEEATRLGVFQRGLKEGMTPMEAAFMARNSTVDFQKMGTWMRYLNQVIPFVNARTQGTVNLALAAAKDPYVFARRQMYFTVYPTLMTYANNSRYMSYYTIPDYLKHNNWVIMAGETQGTDADGNQTAVPHYITIPKSEASKALSMTIERMFDVASGADVQDTQAFLMDMLQSQSPLAVTDALPPMLSTAFELTANYDLFREREIVPEFMQNRSPQFQAYPDTPDGFQKIGNLLGVSPLQVEFAVGNIFGPIPRDTLKVSDLLIEGFSNEGYKKVPNDEFEHWSQIPVIDSIIRTSNFREDISVEEAQKTAETRRADITAQVDAQTRDMVRNNDIESIRLYFQKNVDAFATGAELESAVNRVMKRLIERNTTKSSYTALSGEALYYLYWEEVSGGAMSIEEALRDALKKGANPNQLDEMAAYFLSK